MAVEQRQNPHVTLVRPYLELDHTGSAGLLSMRTQRYAGIASAIQCESLAFVPPKRSTERSVGSGNGNLSLAVAGLAIERVGR